MYLNLYPKRRVMFVNGINLPSYKSLPQFLNKKPQGAMLSLLDGVLVHRTLSLPLLPLPPPPLKKKCNNWASITIHKLHNDLTTGFKWQAWVFLLLRWYSVIALTKRGSVKVTCLTQEHNTMNEVATPPPPQQVTTLRREPLNLWYDLCPVIV